MSLETTQPCFVYSNKGRGIPIPLHVIHYDPLLNSLKNVTRILCTPCDRVPVSSIWMFESGMRRLCFGQVCERKELLNINVNQQVHDTSQVKFSKEKEISVIVIELFQTVPTELYITCVFNTYNRAIRYFSNDTFKNILLLLKKRFHVDVKFLCYRNLENQIISIENEKDWKVLLWILEKRKEKDLKLYLARNI
ncbi:9239_t:CDS:2 [Diversispora eburnea]|uniref:9239_t:CDS:1 n=1 Tax=Diversispora eburnea TaxID=1213867 RepID=A0A9N9A231_9GLOM|nr:9239_t:CDS:2 [Diversispora eburnea]